MIIPYPTAGFYTVLCPILARVPMPLIGNGPSSFSVLTRPSDHPRVSDSEGVRN
jgi:hypothetical protein